MNKNVKGSILLTLLCEWNDCIHVYDTMEYFVNHIREHLNEHKKNTVENSEDVPIEERMVCLWKDCASETKFETWGQLAQHVYYHSFHQKLKCHGIALLNSKLDQSQNYRCLMDVDGRNLIPDSPFRLICHWLQCQNNFEDPETFYTHVSNHVDYYPSGNNVKGGCQCLWEGCVASVKSKHKLRDHLRSHTQEKLFACPTCGGVFANATKFRDHFQRQVDSGALLTYRCSYCSKMFLNERILRDHMRHHVYHYKCPFCDMTCPNPSSLRTHIRYRHSNHRPFVCNNCGFKAKLAVDLKKHLESHDNDWIKCPFKNCLFRARFPWEINLHEQNRHEGLEVAKYLCHLCSKKYRRGTHLTKHLKKKHRLREPSGHVRLRYQLHDDGFYRLQEFRYESSELQEQQLASDLDGGRRCIGMNTDEVGGPPNYVETNLSNASSADEDCISIVDMDDIFYENCDG